MKSTCKQVTIVVLKRSVRDKVVFITLETLGLVYVGFWAYIIGFLQGSINT